MSYEFEVNSKGMMIAIKGEIPEHLTIPEQVHGIVVKEIAEGLLQCKKQLKSIFIPKSIEVLKCQQFMNCKNLESVTFDKDSKITSIPERCFEWAFSASKKSKIILPDSVKFIGYRAFYSSNVTEIVFNRDLLTIYSCAFENSNAEIFNFEKAVNLKVLNSSCFAKCNEIKEIDLSNTNIEYASYYLFYDAKRIEKVILPDTVVSLNTNSFARCVLFKTLICNWSKIEAIHNGAFADSGIENLDLSDFIGDIHDNAFKNSKLKEIVLSDYTGRIGIDAFNSTPVLRSGKLRFPIFCR